MNKKINIPFARQKTKQRNTAAALCVVCTLFLTAGSFSSCTHGNNENDLSKFILGKWEMIGYGGFLSQWEIIANDPGGSYVEFLSDGTARNYDPDNKEFFYYRTYKIDENFIIYAHEKTYYEGRFEYKYKFIRSRLEMTHHQGNTNELSAGHIHIYQRKK